MIATDSAGSRASADFPPRERLLWMYETMLKIRLFEEQVAEFYKAGRLPGFLHTAVGQEAVSTGVGANLRPTDYICSTHRGHGDVIAKGARLDRMMAELFARDTGYCRGKGGSMHVADFSLGILGANAIVAASLPIATGAAFAAWYRREDRVAVGYFSDGGSNQGAFHEALNLGATWNLPVIYVCHNNRYAHSVPQSQHQKIVDIADRAAAYGMPGVVVDGQDVLAVYKAAGEALDRARSGQGPTLIECKTYRLVGHYVGDTPPYRPAEEEAAARLRDPLRLYETRLAEAGILTSAEMEGMQATVARQVEEAVAFAEASPLPPLEAALADVYADESDARG